MIPQSLNAGATQGCVFDFLGQLQGYLGTPRADLPNLDLCHQLAGVRKSLAVANPACRLDMPRVGLGKPKIEPLESHLGTEKGRAGVGREHLLPGRHISETLTDPLGN